MYFFAFWASWFKKNVFVSKFWSQQHSAELAYQRIFLELMMYHTRKVQRREVAECVESVVKELKYGVLFCHRLPKYFCTKHCTVYFVSGSLFLVWYVIDSWNVRWHSKSVLQCFRPKFATFKDFLRGHEAQHAKKMFENRLSIPLRLI